MKTQRKRIVSFIESLLISALLCAVLAAGIQLETPQVQALSQGMQQVMAARQRRLLIPGGDVFGIKVYALGVMVVGTAEVETEQGQVNPAAQAGIRVKDVITCVDGEPIRTVEKLMQDHETFGLLFEALVERDLRIYADVLGGHLYHFRDNSSGDEVDAILEFKDGTYAAFEIKLSDGSIGDALKSLSVFYENVGKKPVFMCAVAGHCPAVMRDPKTGIFIVPLTSLAP